MADQQYAPPPQPQQQTNGLGIAGFIVSLVGLVSCGLLSPIGLILSFIALFSAPKGFAIAGFVLGLLGSAWVLVFFFVIGVAGIAFIAAAVGFQGHADLLEDHVALDEAVRSYYQSEGRLPPSLADLQGLEQERTVDHWGNEYRLDYDEQTGELTIISNGPDAQPDTDDDLRLTIDDTGGINFTTP
jgi:hypothetical protein